MKKHLPIVILAAILISIWGCNNPPATHNQMVLEANISAKYTDLAKKLMTGEIENPFIISLSPLKASFYIPPVNSFATATYNGMWIVIGGSVAGFHGTANNPPPFMKSVANDSLWVIDPVNEKSYGVPVPEQYRTSLAVTNPEFFQVGSSLYMCGGYTISDTAQPRFNVTSDYFFRVDVPNFIQYVQSGGASPTLDQVFPVVLRNEFVQVTGGEMIIVNNNFYLVGGQNFDGVYTMGSTGIYTNAIRSFNLQQTGNIWTLSNMNSLVDSVNLHRRDMNLVPYVTDDGTLGAIILGGVFTPKDLSYNNPVYITGLASGSPAITVGTSQQKCNQYNCAVAPITIGAGSGMLYWLLGGITYMQYDSDSAGLVIGDKGVPMPFSNLVDFIVTDGDSIAEIVQMPPQPLLPGYLGSNAAFIPQQRFLSDSWDGILDVFKIFADTASVISIGYMYGGILSDGPTSGTTLKGHINTYAPQMIYSVDMSIDSSLLKTAFAN